MPVGNKRVVGLQLLVDPFGLEHFLDTQHLLDLVLDGQGILKIQSGMLSQRHLPRFFVGHHLLPESGPLLRVFLQGPKIST